MIAYRLGQLPDLDRPKELEKLPQGPRLSVSEAALVKLPDGTLLASASAEQVAAWFARLAEQASASKNILEQILSGLDLELWEDRWYALNELLELGSVRDVFEGKAEPAKERVWHGGLTREALDALLRSYGLRVMLSRKPNGLGQVYGQRNTEWKRKIYLGTISMLGEGRLTEEIVRAKVEAKLRSQREEEVAA